MRLNNKGFAITAVLYGLLILFVILVSSYLVVLSAKKDRVENLTNEIEKAYIEEYANRCPNVNITLREEDVYTIPYSGKYLFNITHSNNDQVFNCEVYLEKNDVIMFSSSAIKNNYRDILFDNQDCSEIVYYKLVDSINSISYVCE